MIIHKDREWDIIEGSTSGRYFGDSSGRAGQRISDHYIYVGVRLIFHRVQRNDYGKGQCDTYHI